MSTTLQSIISGFPSSRLIDHFPFGIGGRNFFFRGCFYHDRSRAAVRYYVKY